MSFLGGILLGSAAVVLMAVAFVSDELSQKEKQQRQKMNDEYEQYRERIGREYDGISRYYADKRVAADSKYTSEIIEYQRQLKEKKKKEKTNCNTNLQ